MIQPTVPPVHLEVGTFGLALTEAVDQTTVSVVGHCTVTRMILAHIFLIASLATDSEEIINDLNSLALFTGDAQGIAITFSGYINLCKEQEIIQYYY